MFSFFNLIFIVLAAAPVIVGSFKNMTFLLVAMANTVIGIFQETRQARRGQADARHDRLALCHARRAAHLAHRSARARHRGIRRRRSDLRGCGRARRAASGQRVAADRRGRCDHQKSGRRFEIRQLRDSPAEGAPSSRTSARRATRQSWRRRAATCARRSPT